MRKLQLVIKQHFDAAHFLPGYDGPCANLHGHRWDVDAVFTIWVPESYIPSPGISVDFKNVKKLLKDCLPDHKDLNPLFDNGSPSAENIAMMYFDVINEELNHCTYKDPKSFPDALRLTKLIIWESPDCGVVFEG